jgi:nucleotide-binding universal stress UspA family protein
VSSLATVMVHVGEESEARVELALALADRFRATLIGVAGLVPRPVLVAGGVAVYAEGVEQDYARARASLDEMGRRFRARGASLEQVEWRSALAPPVDLLVREARAADVVVLGPRQRNDPLRTDPGLVLLRAGRPVLVVPAAAASIPLRRAVVAWKDTRECRRAVSDAIPLLQQAEEVLLVEIAEAAAHSVTAAAGLADIRRYLERHRVLVAGEARPRAKGSAGAALLQFVRSENADLIVAGGYGHSRLGEWIFGGMTRDLLAECPVCCMLSH